MKHLFAFLALWGFLSMQAQACAVCFGGKGDPVTEAMGMSILFMIVVITTVLLAIVGFFARFLIRASRHPMNQDSVGDAV